MSKHTPGPWTYNLTMGVVRSVADEFSNCRQPVICDLRRWPHEDTTYIDPANARLITAAPDMLEAAKNALDALNAIHIHGDVACVVAPDGEIYLRPVIDALRQVIAKATGETK